MDFLTNPRIYIYIYIYIYIKQMEIREVAYKVLDARLAKYV